MTRKAARHDLRSVRRQPSAATQDIPRATRSALPCFAEAVIAIAASFE
jgi:hypothetical protein